MSKILLLSDTHGCADEKITNYIHTHDEIWHAGDWLSCDLADIIENEKPLKAVWGNVDGADIKARFPKILNFENNGLRISMTHIGGNPNKYNQQNYLKIKEYNPHIFICGHSHILRIEQDKINNWIYINPGAAGIYGFHKVRTMVSFEIENAKIFSVKVIELGNRSII